MVTFKTKYLKKKIGTTQGRNSDKIKWSFGHIKYFWYQKLLYNLRDF